MKRWLPLVLVGCATSGDPFEAESELAQALTTAEAARVLDLVNYPGVDAAELDGAVGLDARAANAIAAYRAGADGRFPSLDDDDFTELAELDALPYVGDAAFAKLLAYATAHPAPAAERHEHVVFEGWQAEIVLWGANTVPIGVLRGLLDDRAADNVFAGRPYATLAEVAGVELIGPNALQALRGQARTWWHARANQPSLAGTFDGVAFDEPTAQLALELANTEPREDLVAGGVVATGAAAIVGNRPYTTLGGVAAVSGVGAATMRSLHAYATSLLGRDVQE